MSKYTPEQRAAFAKADRKKLLQQAEDMLTSVIDNRGIMPTSCMDGIEDLPMLMALMPWSTDMAQKVLAGEIPFEEAFPLAGEFTEADLEKIRELLKNE